MATTEERVQILKMIENGKITAEEGQKLLEALGRRRAEPGAWAAEAPQWLRIRVTDRRGERDTLNVTIPMRLVDIGLKMGARFAPDLDLDWDELRATLRSGTQGRIVEVVDEEDRHIEIFVE